MQISQIRKKIFSIDQSQKCFLLYLFLVHVSKSLWLLLYSNLLQVLQKGFFVCFGLFVSVFCRPKDLKFANNLKIPKNGSVYEFVYLRKQYGSWYKWSNLISPLNIDEKAKVNTSHFRDRTLISAKGINSTICSLISPSS